MEFVEAQDKEAIKNHERDYNLSTLILSTYLPSIMFLTSNFHISNGFNYLI